MVQNDITEQADRARSRMNTLGAAREPFLFILDFALRNPLIITQSELPAYHVWYDFNGRTNFTIDTTQDAAPLELQVFPPNLTAYREAFEVVMQELQFGNSFLMNLTCRTPISINWSLREIFSRSRAKYKLWYEDRFVVFSPETFVRIEGGRIATFPMKGTIDASLPHAADAILSDEKESAEHLTIVDLLRNDLSTVAHDVVVDKYRYLDEVRTHGKTLLQVSSEISGRLDENYHEKLGDLLFALLPAGSISGAPKRKTLEILERAERHERGYFSGVCGYFDGVQLDSGVMIRFIEKEGKRYLFKSGGGITTQSIMGQEYQEMLDKIYVPVY